MFIIMKEKHHYKLRMKLKNTELDIESSDKEWIEETLAVFISLSRDEETLDDAIEKINAMIEDIQNTPTE